MKVCFTLSDPTFETLRIFCAYNLKGDLDATSYAEGLVSEYEKWEGDVEFEIRGFHTASGNPATSRFDRSTDFGYCDLTEQPDTAQPETDCHDMVHKMTKAFFADAT